MGAEFAVENARLVLRGRPVEGSLVVREGRVERVAKVAPQGLRRANARGRLLLPGAVDLHVHFRDLEQAAKEEWSTGSAAAAAGGVTTVVEMPNTRPPATSVEAFQRKLAAARRQSRVDFALAAGYDGANLRTLPRLWRAGAAAFGEVFMYGLSPELIARGIERIARLRAPAILHAESRGCVEADSMRPPDCEIEAVRWLAGRFPGHRIHVAHVSTPEALGAARAAGFTAEVTPHHLLLSDRDRKGLGPFGWCHPPLRGDAQRKLLVDLVRRGFGEAVASDHAPHLRSEKESGDPPPGVPGVETMVPVLLSAVRRRLLPLGRAVDLLSRGPASVLDLGAKGGLDPGKDADFMLVDLKAERKIRARHLHSKCGWTPFEGRPGVFPEAVYLRGVKVAEKREVVGEPGEGRFLPGRGARKPS